MGTQIIGEGHAYLAKFHKGKGLPKSEFAALMSISGYCDFDDACRLYDDAPIEVGANLGR